MTGNVNKRKLLIWIPIIAIALNGAAYLIVTSLRGSPSADPPTAVAKLTVTARELGPESVRGKLKSVVPESPSAALMSPTEAEGVGSLSMMVSVAVLWGPSVSRSPEVLSVALTVSNGSSTLSSRMGTVNVLLVSPAAKVSVPEVRV